MIIYVDSKSGKVDLTKKQLDKLLKEKYDEGYEAGKKTNNIYSYCCPYGYNYWGCPHRWTSQPSITWTSSGYCSDNITTSSDTITTASSNIPSTATQGSTTSNNVTIKYQEV